MPRAIKPYLTTTPWQPFTARERKREAVLAHCPSSRCRRAKACVDAHDNIYCQRSHESLAESRARRGLPPPSRRKAKLPTLMALRARIVETDLLLAEAEAATKAMQLRWKEGEFTELYGKFKRGGVWKHPPVRQYTE